MNRLRALLYLWAVRAHRPGPGHQHGLPGRPHRWPGPISPGQGI